MSYKINQLIWTGVEKSYLDSPIMQRCGHVNLGCYGGNSSAGATKNEDAALILASQNESWTFVALCDAHYSSESAVLITNFLSQYIEVISQYMSKPVDVAFSKLEQFLIQKLLSSESKEAFHQIQGESALLLCAQKDTFIWWLSIGDNLVYLFHPDLAKMGQFALNQRHFFEWIGQANSLALTTPCYSRGVSELRKGVNHITLLTDGVLEFQDSPFSDSAVLYEVYKRYSTLNSLATKEILQTVHTNKGQDSATIISFSVNVENYTGVIPSG